MQSRQALRPLGSLDDTRPGHIEHAIFLTLVAVASSTIMIKVADVQLLEILFLFFLPVLLLYLLNRNLVLTLDSFSKNLAIHYFILFALICFLALVDLRLPFFVPSDATFLKRPILITISRLMELGLAVCFLLFFYHLFKESPRTFRFAARGFYLCGAISALFSILSLPIQLATNIDLGVFGDAHRARGFFNEGGPYGLYLIGVALVGFYLKERRWISRLAFYVSIILILIAFLGSQSKAAFAAVLIMIFINAVVVSALKFRIGMIATVACILVVLFYATNVPLQIANYINNSAQYELLAAQRPEDVNLVVGRVAAIVIVPRMIAAHPITGIGLGNYGLMRNDPLYRGVAPYVEWFDLPGLGLVGYAAELGLPLFLYFTFLLLKPYSYLRRTKADLIVQNMALFQLIATLFGAQLNLYYPWIITAFALSASISQYNSLSSNAPSK